MIAYRGLLVAVVVIVIITVANTQTIAIMNAFVNTRHHNPHCFDTGFYADDQPEILHHYLSQIAIAIFISSLVKVILKFNLFYHGC